MAAGPAATLGRLWRHNRWLTLSFAITLTLALVFLIRAGVFFVYWQDHRDEPIEGWMTIRYVANSYRVEPKLVRDAIGLETTGPDRRPLLEIARDEGRPLDALTAAIVDAIAAERAAAGAANGDAPSPAGSAPTAPQRP